MTLIIGCGGDDRFVEFNKNELNSFVEKGFELIKAKNNNANMDFYSPETLKNFDEKRYKYLKSKDFRLYGSVKGYQYMIFSVNKDKSDKREFWALICEDSKAENCKIENATGRGV
ncbi:hypothetical protein ACFF6B_000464 [Campylobacter coli]|nr:hypothetical protein cco115_07128 [Campylobacter coli 2692]EIE4182599.1 hypothetical protein [Campylobacter coli]EIM5593089.1 hypothetical protein [Campylobacter coli]EIQ2337766.1 hypothetical protein [Campylobacter coli]EIQ8740768.1 hypothetical protein [Campylobacter coli]